MQMINPAVGETVELRNVEVEMVNDRGEVVAVITAPTNGEPLMLTGVAGFSYRLTTQSLLAECRRRGIAI